MTNKANDEVKILEDTSAEDVFIDITEIKPRLEETDKGSVPETTGTHFAVTKHQKQDNDDPVLFVAAFDSNFSTISGVSPASSTKALVHNFDTVKLVDIITGEILWQFESEKEKGEFHHISGYTDGKSFLFLQTPQLIKQMDTNSTVSTIIQKSFGSFCNDNIHIYAFEVTRNGEIVACVNKEKGCICCLTSAPYIQLYTIGGKLLREKKLQYQRRNLLKQAFNIVENNNGDICIAAEKCSLDYSEWVVVLDKSFKFKFTYEGENNKDYSCSSLAVSSKNEILIVSGLQFIDIINETGEFLRRFPVEHFDAEGLPKAISNDNDGNIWIITSMDKLVCVKI